MFDFVILAVSLFAVLMVFFLPRHLIFGPLILAWAGAAAGVALGMIFHYDRVHDRVDLDRSLPLMILGLCAGMLPGALISRIYRASPASRGWVEVFDVTVLFGGVGMLAGTWLGIKSESRPPDETVIGIVGGAILGFLVGLGQWLAEGRKKVGPGEVLPNETPIIE